MKNEGCSKCAEASVEGTAYIDNKTGLLCVSLDKPNNEIKGLKVLTPVVCTNCGTTTWKTIDTIENKK